MTESYSEVDETSTELTDDNSVSETAETPVEKKSSASREITSDDVNDDPSLASGLFLSRAMSLRYEFLDMRKEDPSATYRLTVERL